MPFGLTNAPATYSRLVEKVLDGLDRSFVTAFLDDIAIHTPTLDEHFGMLQQVFTAQFRAGLTIQPRKCQLFQEKIEFLGHVVSAKGIAPQNKHVEQIKN